MKLKNWVTENPATVAAGESLETVVSTMVERGIGAVLVTDEGRLVGIFTERDLMRLIRGGGPRALEQPLREAMTGDPVCAAPDDDYNEVYLKMQTNGVRHIPVVDKGRPVGIVSIRDLTRFYQNKLESEYVDAKREIARLRELLEEPDLQKIQTLLDEIERYRELSLTDELTGLYNKRYFLSRLREEASRAGRYRQPLSLVFCDIDHFKRINDTHGHDVGDRVLSQIGALLAGEVDELSVVSRLRKSDIVARYGGEEFVAILPETDGGGAARAAEKMRQAIAGHPFSLNGENSRITMSFGVAELHGEDHFEDLIRHADEAMYRAKRQGRNRVVVYDEPAGRSHPSREGGDAVAGAPAVGA